MDKSIVLTIRDADSKDRNRLTNLLHFESHVHTHLDWRRPMDWLGHEPFLVALRGERVVAALAAPPDPPGIAWLRLFAASDRIDYKRAWDLLWPACLQELTGKVETIIAIPTQLWTENLLLESQFEHTHDVVVLDWIPEYGAPAEEPSQIIREMATSDLNSVAQIDNASFSPLWQNSLQSIQYAFGQAARATVIEIDGKLCAYQISTLSPHGMHLARMAVHPDMQGKRLAYSLVRDLQIKVSEMRDQRLTVNTQGINVPSLALYKKAGFKFTQEKLPVFERHLS